MFDPAAHRANSASLANKTVLITGDLGDRTSDRACLRAARRQRCDHRARHRAWPSRDRGVRGRRCPRVLHRGRRDGAGAVARCHRPDLRPFRRPRRRFQQRRHSGAAGTARRAAGRRVRWRVWRECPRRVPGDEGGDRSHAVGWRWRSDHQQRLRERRAQSQSRARALLGVKAAVLSLTRSAALEYAPHRTASMPCRRAGSRPR